MHPPPTESLSAANANERAGSAIVQEAGSPDQGDAGSSPARASDTELLAEVLAFHIRRASHVVSCRICDSWTYGSDAGLIAHDEACVIGRIASRLAR